MVNLEIKDEIYKNCIKMWEIAEKMGITDSSLSVKTLRNAREKLEIICTRGKNDDKSWYMELAHDQNTRANRANKGTIAT